MPNKPALVVMAAGMGSRYGGLKQMDPVTEQGEVLLDFSVYDALFAGFEKIVIIIKHEIERDFEEMVGKRLRKQADIRYAYQELTDLPQGYSPSPERKKPWGTGHAVLAARKIVNEPFAVINADDYYGKSAFAVMSDFLQNKCSAERYAMVGYRLGNTLTEHGTVARGICEVENGFLRGLTERTKIMRRGEEAAFTEDDGSTWSPLPLDTLVSMQLFGFAPSVFNRLEEGFLHFLKSPHDPLKGEYLLPSRIGELTAQNKVSLEVLSSPDRWFGVTYQQDKPSVVNAVKALREQGAYPPVLW